jgi:hypothetical protein
MLLQKKIFVNLKLRKGTLVLETTENPTCDAKLAVVNKNDENAPKTTDVEKGLGPVEQTNVIVFDIVPEHVEEHAKNVFDPFFSRSSTSVEECEEATGKYLDTINSKPFDPGGIAMEATPNEDSGIQYNEEKVYDDSN